MKIRWQGLHGYVDGGRRFEVVEHTGEWMVYVRGDHLDDVRYPSEDAAKAAAEAAVDTVPPLPPQPRRQRRRFVRNRWTEWAPHPGTLRKPPP